MFAFHLKTVDGDVSFQMLWELDLCSLSFEFQKQDLEPWLCMWGAPAHAASSEGWMGSLFHPLLTEFSSNLMHHFPKHHLNL